MKKFKGEVSEDEKVIETFNCGVKSKMFYSLTGMLYITEAALYFYSPFNKKTFLGSGSKIRIAYWQIQEIKKSS